MREAAAALMLPPVVRAVLVVMAAEGLEQAVLVLVLLELQTRVVVVALWAQIVVMAGVVVLVL